MSKEVKEIKRPTDTEFVILRALWEIGPSSVRQVNDHINKYRVMGYTTVLKLMQIMTTKGLLVKDISTRPQIFKPVEEKKITQKGLVKDLAQRAFGGSAGTLALQALSMSSASKEELDEIRQLIDKIERQADES